MSSLFRNIFHRRGPASHNSLSDAAAEARAVIPRGIVQRACQALEQQLFRHAYENARVYIARVGRNTEQLLRNGRTYSQQLIEIQRRGLDGLDRNLVDFLRDHLNLCHAVDRSILQVKIMQALENADVLRLVQYRGLSLRNFGQTRSEDERARMMRSAFFVTEFDQCAQSLQGEIIHQLTCLKRLRDASSTDVELENVGADHNVDDHGHEASPRNSSIEPDECHQRRRCCICLESYTADHPAFQITRCKHVVGKTCLSTWLNGTTLNANSCPHCRKVLCARRPRQPADFPGTDESNRIGTRLKCALELLGELERLQNEIFGAAAAAEFLGKAIDGVNYEFFVNDIDYYLDYEAAPRPRWGVRMVDWHSG